MEILNDINKHNNINIYYVYTDGACKNNGKKNAKAGIGVFFGHDDPRNIAHNVIGKQTNNIAELEAVKEAINVIYKELINNIKFCIVTDSEYVIKCCTTYGKKCDMDNWKKDIPNKDWVKYLYNYFKQFPNLSIMHIEAHTGKQDIHSLGNEEADKLANIAIGENSCPYTPNKILNKKMFLKVKYEDKDQAKSLGAKWDPSKKKWYYMTNLSEEKKEKLVELFS